MLHKIKQQKSRSGAQCAPYEKTIKNYFIDMADEETWDGDLQCIDMYYYSKDLKNS